MPYFADRFDFVDPDTICARIVNGKSCRRLTSGTAYVLRDENGVENVYGRTCAGHMLGGDIAQLKGIPDFTTRDLTGDGDQENDPSGGGPGGNPGHDQNQVEKDLAQAKRYLLLRMEKVADIPGIDPQVKFQPLLEIYNSFKETRKLADEQVRHIINIEQSEKTPVVFKTSHLLDVYTAYIQLKRRLRNETDEWQKNFLSNCLSNHLPRKLHLSEKQILKAGLKLHQQAFK